MKAKVPEQITLAAHHERVEYLDMICLMALHREFGFGPARLRRYYDAIVEADKYYKRYNSNVITAIRSRCSEGKRGTATSGWIFGRSRRICWI